MTPFDLIVWSLAVAAGLLVVGLAGAVVYALFRGVEKSKVTKPDKNIL